MTEIVSVSAATAAYATEGLKPSARISGSTQTPDLTYLQTQEARAADNHRHAQMINVVDPPSIALFFLTAGERNRVLAQTTLREAEEAYFFGKEEAEETQARHDDAEQDSAEDDAGAEEGQERAEFPALPSPEDMS